MPHGSEHPTVASRARRLAVTAEQMERPESALGLPGRHAGHRARATDDAKHCQPWQARLQRHRLSGTAQIQGNPGDPPHLPVRLDDFCQDHVR